VNSRDINTEFANALVDEWARGGVTHAVVAPGSRSAPLALAVARDARVQVHVVLDERSAAFFALGIGKETGRPAVLVCTSGTAGANFHPAVVEAHHANVPLLVSTADRPPELHGVGAPQTIDQRELYGRAVRWYHDPGPPEAAGDDAATAAQWRSLACRALAATMQPRPGPVHLNLPFREPLVPTGAPLVAPRGRADGRPWTVTTTAPRAVDDAAARLADLVRTSPKGVVFVGFGTRVDAEVIGAFSRASGWPVLADPVSGARCGAVVSTYEALLRAEGWARAHVPDAVLRLGAPLTSKVANAWAESVPTVLVDEYDEWLDPPRASNERIVASPSELLRAATALLADHEASSQWALGWERAEHVARDVIDDFLDRAAPNEQFEGRVARDLVGGLPPGTRFAVASSLPVRAVEWCMAAREGVTVHANRGANGIDGFLSTVLGIATASRGAPTVALVGDLCFLHDTNGLLGAAAAPVDAVFVVVDNRGGGIFSYLPPAELPEFEELFATPQSVDVAAVARAHGVDAERVGSAGDVQSIVKDALAKGGVRVVVVDVDRQRSVEHHRAMFAAVAQALTT
jgi:2-succinyl-5-enolpyruvyl-6-hydroxy-3-cyclohexene-1-carboxylate synthase